MQRITDTCIYNVYIPRQDLQSYCYRVLVEACTEPRPMRMFLLIRQRNPSTKSPAKSV